MTERNSECRGSFEFFGSYNFKDYNGKYIAVGGLSCPEEGCDFDGSIEGGSYDSVDDARVILERRARVQSLTRCKLYADWRRDPDNFGKEPPQEVLPEFVRQRPQERD